MKSIIQIETDDSVLPNALLRNIRLLKGVRLAHYATPKQIVSGYHRPVCPECQCELRPETNGVGVLDMFSPGSTVDAKPEPYELFDADLWKCPKCGKQVVGGFATNPISAHYESDFRRMISHYKSNSTLIPNNG